MFRIEKSVSGSGTGREFLGLLSGTCRSHGGMECYDDLSVSDVLFGEKF